MILRAKFHVVSSLLSVLKIEILVLKSGDVELERNNLIRPL